jgi:cobalt-zinc-cadmium resistance protein CzcA
MLARLVQFALAQRLFVLIAGALLDGRRLAGLHQDLPIDAFPDVSSTQVKIIMKAPA